jgi:hypothetical protein
MSFPKKTFLQSAKSKVVDGALLTANTIYRMDPRHVFEIASENNIQKKLEEKLYKQIHTSDKSSYCYNDLEEIVKHEKITIGENEETINQIISRLIVLNEGRMGRILDDIPNVTNNNAILFIFHLLTDGYDDNKAIPEGDYTFWTENYNKSDVIAEMKKEIGKDEYNENCESQTGGKKRKYKKSIRRSKKSRKHRKKTYKKRGGGIYRHVRYNSYLPNN